MNGKTLTAEQCSKLSLYILMTTKTREGEAEAWEKLAEEKKGVSMNNYQSITASPEALAAFLGSIPAIETPWDDAFHRLYCSSCSAADCDDCRRPERDSPLWWLGLPAAEVEK